MTRVLIVDPNVARRSMIRGRISDAGHGALAAANGEECTIAVEAGGVDLVLLATEMVGRHDTNGMCAILKGSTGYAPAVVVYEVEDAPGNVDGAFEAGNRAFGRFGVGNHANEAHRFEEPMADGYGMPA